MISFKYSSSMSEYIKENNITTKITEINMITRPGRAKKYFKFQLTFDVLVFEGTEKEGQLKQIVTAEKVADDRYRVLSGYGQLSRGVLYI